MSHHISEELPRLLTGDANRDVVMAAAEHLRTCPDCQQELVSAVVAHASLTSAHRFAPEIVAPDSTVLDLVGGKSDDGYNGDGSNGDNRSDGVGVVDLPNMSSMFAQVRSEAATKPAKTSKRTRLLAVAAAAVVLSGGTVAVVEATTGSASRSQNVALAAYETGDKPASATIGKNWVTVNATSLPKLDASHQYEVWLTDAARTNMQPIGFIGNNNRAKLTIPAKVKMSNFTDIEVSVQRVGQSGYIPGTSVLRGDYGS